MCNVCKSLIVLLQCLHCKQSTLYPHPTCALIHYIHTIVFSQNHLVQTDDLNSTFNSNLIYVAHASKLLSCENCTAGVTLDVLVTWYLLQSESSFVLIEVRLCCGNLVCQQQKYFPQSIFSCLHSALYFNCPTFLFPLLASQLLADEPTAWAEKNPALYILNKVGKMRRSLGSRFQCKKKFLPSLARTLGSSRLQCKKIQHNKWRIPAAKPTTSPYLIFVIFFTLAKFLENKIYTKKTRILRQNTQ